MSKPLTKKQKVLRRRESLRRHRKADEAKKRASWLAFCEANATPRLEQGIRKYSRVRLARKLRQVEQLSNYQGKRWKKGQSSSECLKIAVNADMLWQRLQVQQEAYIFYDFGV